MDTKIFNILNLLEENNYESYIVGGYVRDFILNKKSTILFGKLGDCF